MTKKSRKKPFLACLARQTSQKPDLNHRSKSRSTSDMLFICQPDQAKARTSNLAKGQARSGKSLIRFANQPTPIIFQQI
jgi:hypothetical protein